MLDERGLSSLFGSLTREFRDILERALEGREVSVADGVRLATATGREVVALCLVADELRRRQSGDTVTYVVNRNVNFTNVCVKHCTFCAFSRDHREGEGYFLPVEEIVRRAREAAELGATEVCIQAGLAPKLPGTYYIDLVRAIKRELPDLHIHAFSPEEVLYGSARSGMPIREYLAALKEAGLGSLPGTSAEILDDRVRNVIARGRISTRQWIEVITAAHQLGIPTTSTIMYGHVESPIDRVKHLALLRSIQEETGGFTEFVPLSFVHQEAPMYRRRLVPGVRQGATGSEVLVMHALARLMLGERIRNIQASWVKEGPKLVQVLLGAGANDLGGTLINESISTAAGAAYGQMLSPAEMRRLIRGVGRVPAQRDTLYRVLATYERPEDDEASPLDDIADAEQRFGSYWQLTASAEYRYQPVAAAVVPTPGGN